MSDSWWSKKLGGGGGAPSAPPRPAAAPPGSGWTPPTRPLPAPHEQQASPAYTQHGEVEPDETGQVHAIDAVQAWRGGVATRTERDVCPNCGSHRYFSRSNSGGVVNVNTGQRATPAPICEDCGFPLVQSGSPTGELAAVAPTGGGVARQAPSSGPPLFTVVGRVS